MPAESTSRLLAGRARASGSSFGVLLEVEPLDHPRPIRHTPDTQSRAFAFSRMADQDIPLREPCCGDAILLVRFSNASTIFAGIRRSCDTDLVLSTPGAGTSLSCGHALWQRPCYCCRQCRWLIVAVDSCVIMVVRCEIIISDKCTSRYRVAVCGFEDRSGKQGCIQLGQLGRFRLSDQSFRSIGIQGNLTGEQPYSLFCSGGCARSSGGRRGIRRNVPHGTTCSCCSTRGMRCRHSRVERCQCNEL